MRTSRNPIIRQFLAGRAKGPIGMDEMSQEDGEMGELTEDDDAEIMTV